MALVGRAQAAWEGGDAAGALNFLREVRELGVARGPALRLEATIHLERKEYDRAGLLALQYIDVAPGDTEFLYLAAYCLQKAGRLEEAGQCGERVRLREPEHVDNLINLVEVYTQMKNFARAERFADDLLRLDPDNASVQAARAKLPAARK
jgi:tetratricopeptide (TPR) repeat protein